jgi:predicted ArsR family transcriptional regulator
MTTNKASLNLANRASAVRSKANRFLLRLKLDGPQTSAALGATLGITDEAARQQLLKLAQDGQVESTSEASGVGRPSQVWRLTAAGNAAFPDGHADLSAQLIGLIRAELGSDALDRVISMREAETRSAYIAALEGSAGLAERVARLAAIRTREGYMAEWRDDGDGFLLLENHCPICAAASICQGFCRSELQVFRAALGPGVSVERVEHILSGARRCAYRITNPGTAGVPPTARLVKG